MPRNNLTKTICTMLLDFPQEILHSILFMMDGNSWLKLERVSRYFLNESRRDNYSLWKNLSNKKEILRFDFQDSNVSNWRDYYFFKLWNVDFDRSLQSPIQRYPKNISEILTTIQRHIFSTHEICRHNS